MKRWREGVVVAFACLLVVALVNWGVPIGSLGPSVSPPRNPLSSVTFEGTQLQLGVGPEGFQVNWMGSEFRISWLLVSSGYGGTTSVVSLAFSGSQRINDSAQNSLVGQYGGSGLTVAEISSYQDGGFAEAIAVQSDRAVSGTFYAVLEFVGPGPLAIPISPLGSTPGPTTGNAQSLNARTWGLEGTNFGLFWSNLGSEFIGGEGGLNGNQAKYGLVFGPLILAPGETHSLQLNLEFGGLSSSRTGTPPSHLSDFCTRCPSGGCWNPLTGCGGGGGGGGGGGSPPTISSDSISATNLLPGLPVTMSITVGSLGSGTGTWICFDVVTYVYGSPLSQNGCPSESISATGTYSLSWTPSRASLSAQGPYYYYGVAGNSVGPSDGPQVALTAFMNAPASQEVTVYDSSGTVVASVTVSTAAADGIQPVTTMEAGVSDNIVALATAASWTSASTIWGVYTLSQTINPNYLLVGYGGGAHAMSLGYVQYGQQITHDTQSPPGWLDYLLNYLIGIANSFAFGLIPTLSDFSVNDVNSGGVDYYSSASFTYSQGNNQQTVCGGPPWAYHCWTYDLPLKATNGSVAHVFALNTYNDYFANQATAYLDVYAYSISLSLGYHATCINCPTGGSPAFYTVSSSVYTGVWVLPYS